VKEEERKEKKEKEKREKEKREKQKEKERGKMKEEGLVNERQENDLGLQLKEVEERVEKNGKKKSGWGFLDMLQKKPRK